MPAHSPHYYLTAVTAAIDYTNQIYELRLNGTGTAKGYLRAQFELFICYACCPRGQFATLATPESIVAEFPRR